MPTLYPNSGFLLSGINLNFVENVRVGDVPVGALTYLGTTGASGKVPESAFSNEVFVFIGDKCKGVWKGWKRGNHKIRLASLYPVIILSQTANPKMSWTFPLSYLNPLLYNKYLWQWFWQFFPCQSFHHQRLQ